jgi:hypothetical protein
VVVLVVLVVVAAVLQSRWRGGAHALHRSLKPPRRRNTQRVERVERKLAGVMCV